MFINLPFLLPGKIDIIFFLIFSRSLVELILLILLRKGWPTYVVLFHEEQNIFSKGNKTNKLSMYLDIFFALFGFHAQTVGATICNVLIFFFFLLFVIL